jgi:hypothetical protein
MTLSRGALTAAAVLLAACTDPEAVVRERVLASTQAMQGRCMAIEAERIENVVVADEEDPVHPREFIFVHRGDGVCAFFENTDYADYRARRVFHLRADATRLSDLAVLAADTRTQCAVAVLQGHCDPG